MMKITAHDSAMLSQAVREKESALPKELKGSLSTVEQIEKELGDGR